MPADIVQVLEEAATLIESQFAADEREKKKAAQLRGLRAAIVLDREGYNKLSREAVNREHTLLALCRRTSP